VRHFDFLDRSVLAALFEREPRDFTADTDAETLGMALGATLYMPGTRPALAADVVVRAAAGVVSAVLCLEDAIADQDVEMAEENVVGHVRTLAKGSTRADAPLIFIRVRGPAQVVDLADRLGPSAARLTGFVLPKFIAADAPDWFGALAKAEAVAGVPVMCMPVLETAEVVYRETRNQELFDVATVLDERRERVVAVRLGATDLSGLYGLRRARGVSIYDVGVVRDLLADVVNILGRADGSGFAITGPVWEHFPAPERLFKPQLRTTPFSGDPDGQRLRQEMIVADHDELLREVMLDKANGLYGKTIIHPSHVAPVHALLVVSHEEYDDATSIREATGGGARGSSYRNKLNEAGPHSSWARTTLRRAELFGVSRPDVGVIDVLAALSGHPLIG
jgi:citrate lyase beta subunit